ncbi:MAG: ABC transporter ATP-binding protein [Candidatus Omnitrophota bacterium]
MEEILAKEILAAENLNKTFGEGTKAVHAVRGADIRVNKGERLFIHGPSGAGKSTLLHVLAGLDRPTSGSVSFRGEDIYSLSDRKRSALRNRSFGFIFQFYHLLPELSILENVMLPAMIKGDEKRGDIVDRAVYLLESVGLGKRLKHRPSRLSGGEAQRAAIARALINPTDVLFCDEPTGNLDSKMSEDIYNIIRETSEDRGMSVVVVSHQTVISNFPHTEYVMKDGILKKTPVTGMKDKHSLTRKEPKKEKQIEKPEERRSDRKMRISEGKKEIKWDLRFF